MDSVGINLELSQSQVEQLRAVLGTEFNIAEVLGAWANKRLQNEGDLGVLIESLSMGERDMLRFREFTISLTAGLKKQLDRNPDLEIDEIVFEMLKQLTKRDPKAEPLSQTEVDEMLSDLAPGGYRHGPSGIFKCSKMFSGSAPHTELVAVHILIRAHLDNEIDSLAQAEGLSSVEQLVKQKVLAFLLAEKKL